MINSLSPNPGAYTKRQRVGRGGKRGGSSGRGNGGQKHHGKRPQPWFTGLYTNPIIEGLPRWTWAARDAKPRYRTVNLDKLQHWIDMGRLNTEELITMRTLKLSGIIPGKIRDGVKLLANGGEYFKSKGVRIEVSKASRSAINIVESHGGTVRTVYHSRKGIEVLLKPQLYPVRPPFERPVLEKDILYYTNPDFRGYLSSKEVYEKEFKPRGYIADAETEKEFLPEAVEAVKIYEVSGMKNMLTYLQTKRAERQKLYEKEQLEAEQAKKKRQEDWKNQKWFPNQADWKWIEVEGDNVISHFGSPEEEQKQSQMHASNEQEFRHEMDSEREHEEQVEVKQIEAR
ncbi:hypothetical protein MP638_002493 [Amoeboaphelidium occidentale]|nr:hypothetical protein MP638_002493 [Amoeboaphelidium occidentale]